MLNKIFTVTKNVVETFDYVCLLEKILKNFSLLNSNLAIQFSLV